MPSRPTAGSIDEYIAGFPPETRKVLEEMRALIKAAAPDATETISYFIYRIGFRTFNFGYASAASVVMLAITVLVAQLFVKRFFRSGRA